jgi:hypothetical protein
MKRKAVLPQGIQTGCLKLDKQMEHSDIAEGYCCESGDARLSIYISNT